MLWQRSLTASMAWLLACWVVGRIHAEEIRIVSWNVRECFSKSDVQDRRSDFAQAARILKPDVLLLQEVTSFEVCEEIRDAMGLDEYNIWCTDFVADGRKHASFEVALLTKLRVAQVIEFDPAPDGQRVDDAPDESPFPDTLRLGVEDVNTSRGYLWARLRDFDMTVSVVHLKSSVGRVGYSDRDNARAREYVTAAFGLNVLADINLFHDHTHLVAGDFNVGKNDDEKNGSDLHADFDGSDGYDETHALLASGLIPGLRMKNLLGELEESTFPSFPGSPIDNIYVVGTLAEEFKGEGFEGEEEAQATIERDTFGSDHRPIWTIVDAPLRAAAGQPFLRIGPVRPPTE